MNPITQSECQAYIDAGGTASYIGYPSGDTYSAPMILNWLNGLQNLNDYWDTVNLIRAYIKANGGTGN